MRREKRKFADAADVVAAREYQRQMWNSKQVSTVKSDGKTPRRNRRPADTQWPKAVLVEEKRVAARKQKAKARAKRKKATTV